LFKKLFPYRLSGSFHNSGTQPCGRRSTGRDLRLTSVFLVPTVLARAAAYPGPHTRVHSRSKVEGDLPTAAGIAHCERSR